MDSETRRILLRPLSRRKAGSATRQLVVSALDHLDRQALANFFLPELVQTYKAARTARAKGYWKDPAWAKASIELAEAMLISRKISSQEYTFLVAIAAEGVYEGRMSEDAYPEIVDLRASIRSVEMAHNLGPNEYWNINEGPAEYQELNRKFEAAAATRFLETLQELDASDIADLLRSNRKKYDQRRERGRRAFHHKNETIPALADTVVRYEKEARRAASVYAYTAAVTLLAASVEGLLLLRCLRSKKKAAIVAGSLPKAKRPRDVANPAQWTFDTLIETCLVAGWLPLVTTDSTKIRPDRLAHLLRQMRNFIHPGKVATEHPWIEADDHDYTDAEIIYTTIFATVSRGRHLRPLQEAALNTYEPGSN